MSFASVPTVETTVFRVAGRRFSRGDVVAAARHWGAWSIVERAAGEAAATLAEGRGPGRVAFEREAHRWRSARRLLSSDELTGWLDHHDVTVEQWEDYVRGVVLGRSGSGRGGRAAACAPAVWVHAVCGGVLERLACKLAARAAVVAAMGGKLGARGALDGCELKVWEECFRRFEIASTREGALERVVARRRIEWTRVSFRAIVSRDGDAVREVALSVRSDGRRLADLAVQAGLDVEEHAFAIEELPASLRAPLLEGRAGELLGPVVVGEQNWLIDSACMTGPELSDHEIRDRAIRAAANQAVETAMLERVTWGERF